MLVFQEDPVKFFIFWLCAGNIIQFYFELMEVVTNQVTNKLEFP